MANAKMCPYLLSLRQVTQSSYERDDEAGKGSDQIILIENQSHRECIGKKCAAFRWGRCRRKTL